MHGNPDTTAAPTFSDEQPTGANEAAYVLLNASDNVVVDPTFDTADDGDPWVVDVDVDWAIAGGKATHSSGLFGLSLAQLSILTVDDYYLMLWTLLDYSSDYVNITAGTDNGPQRDANGVYADILQCTVGESLTFAPHSSFAGAVDNVYAYNLNTESNSGDLAVIDEISYSYDGTPTGGGLEIADATGIIYSIDIPNAGTKTFEFPGGIFGTRGKPLAVILKPGGAGVSGKLAVKSR